MTTLQTARGHAHPTFVKDTLDSSAARSILLKELASAERSAKIKATKAAKRSIGIRQFSFQGHDQ